MPASHLFFGFTGRINRAKWWLGILVYFLLYLAVYTILFVAFIDDYSYLDVMAMRSGVFRDIGAGWILVGVAGIVAFVSQLALMVKRLHDRDKSGWWVLVFVVFPWVLQFVSVRGNADPTNLTDFSGVGLLGLVNLAIFIWIIVDGCLRGTIGSNRFGTDPLELREPSYPGRRFAEIAAQGLT